MPSLHTSEYNTTPQQAQAVTIPMGMRLSEEYFFYLLVHLPERCSWETTFSQPEQVLCFLRRVGKLPLKKNQTKSESDFILATSGETHMPWGRGGHTFRISVESQ